MNISIVEGHRFYRPDWPSLNIEQVKLDGVAVYAVTASEEEGFVEVYNEDLFKYGKIEHLTKYGKVEIIFGPERWIA